MILLIRGVISTQDKVVMVGVVVQVVEVLRPQLKALQGHLGVLHLQVVQGSLICPLDTHL